MSILNLSSLSVGSSGGGGPLVNTFAVFNVKHSPILLTDEQGFTWLRTGVSFELPTNEYPLATSSQGLPAYFGDNPELNTPLPGNVTGATHNLYAASDRRILIYDSTAQTLNAYWDIFPGSPFDATPTISQVMYDGFGSQVANVVGIHYSNYHGLIIFNDYYIWFYYDDGNFFDQYPYATIEISQLLNNFNTSAFGIFTTTTGIEIFSYFDYDSFSVKFAGLYPSSSVPEFTQQDTFYPFISPGMDGRSVYGTQTANQFILHEGSGNYLVYQYNTSNQDITSPSSGNVTTGGLHSMIYTAFGNTLGILGSGYAPSGRNQVVPQENLVIPYVYGTSTGHYAAELGNRAYYTCLGKQVI